MSECLINSNLIASANLGQRRNGMSLVPRSSCICTTSGVSYSSSRRFPSFKLKSQAISLGSSSDFHGKRVFLRKPSRGNSVFRNSTAAQMALTIGKAHKWWEKGLQPNMKEVTSAQDLVDSLLNPGDKLVVVDFFSPGCGGCKALHPKICQLAEMNPDVQFLQVNYEEHKSVCYSLNVHVLPFFRFYRGAHGRLCSFSCTNATIKKFKDALAKHTPDRCSLGPTKGLEEKELLALSANRDLSFNYSPNLDQHVHLPSKEESAVEEAVTPPSSEPLPQPSVNSIFSPDLQDKALVAVGR